MLLDLGDSCSHGLLSRGPSRRGFSCRELQQWLLRQRWRGDLQVLCPGPSSGTAASSAWQRQWASAVARGSPGSQSWALVGYGSFFGVAAAAKFTFIYYSRSLPVLATPLRERTPQGGTHTVDQGRGNG